MAINPPENEGTELTEEQLEGVAGGDRPSMPRVGKKAEEPELADE